MSVGLFILLLIAIFMLYDIIKHILNLIEYKIKNISRVDKNKKLYKNLDRDIDKAIDEAFEDLDV